MSSQVRSFKWCPPSTARELTQDELSDVANRRTAGEPLGLIAESFQITVSELEAKVRRVSLWPQKPAFLRPEE